jgi:hypothetical protein
LVPLIVFFMKIVTFYKSMTLGNKFKLLIEFLNLLLLLVKIIIKVTPRYSVWNPQESDKCKVADNGLISQKMMVYRTFSERWCFHESAYVATRRYADWMAGDRDWPFGWSCLGLSLTATYGQFEQSEHFCTCTVFCADILSLGN